MKTIGKEKLVAGGLTVLLIAAVITGSILFNSNLSLKSSLSDSKQQNEALTNEKANLYKAINEFKAEIEGLKGKNSDLDKILAETQRKLSDKEKALAGIKRDNASIKNLRKELADLNAMKSELQKQIDALTAQNSSLTAENKKLQSSLAALQSEKEGLLKQIEMAKTSVKPDNIMVETYRNVKKDRLTLNAKRTKKLAVLFNLPQEYTSGISFKITTPDGNVISDKDKSLSWEFSDLSNDDNLLASLNPFPGEFEVTTQVKLSYTPTSKLKPGEYKISILQNGINLGNCRVRLK